MFWQCIEWMNLLTLMPYSLYALYGFYAGDNRIRMPGLITQSFTIYSLVICIGCTLFGPNRTSDAEMFVAIYVPYMIFPICCLWRLWDEKPFSRQSLEHRSSLQQALDAVVKGVVVLTFLVYFAYIFIWFRRYTDWLDGALGVAAGRRAIPGMTNATAAVLTGKTDL